MNGEESGRKAPEASPDGKPEEVSVTTNSWLEDMVYSHFAGVPLKALDAFIAVCIIALVAVIAIGILK